MTSRHFRNALPLALGLTLALAASPALAQSPPEPTPPPTPPPADGEPAQPGSAAALVEQAEAIAGKVGQIRGLARKSEIDKGVRDRDALRADLERRVKEDHYPQEIEGERALFVRLGLMPPQMDYEGLVLDMLTEQIAGYYDSETAELYLIEGLPALVQKPAMAHEIFHAIQDQHFTLKAVHGPEAGLAGLRTNGDRALARSALLEGDATVLMLDFALYEQGALAYGSGKSFIDVPAFSTLIDGMLAGAGGGMVQSPALARAPMVVQELLAFPYMDGLRFVVALRRGRSWSDVDAVYLDPPDSTEQILHPERYLERDAPTLVTLDTDAVAAALPAASGEAPWELLWENVLGELRFRLWFDQHLSDAALGPGGEGSLSVEGAAAGWDGDRVYVFRSGDRDVAVSASIWDTDADAEEAAAALTRQSLARKPSAVHRRARGPHGGLDCVTVGDEGTLIERWGRWVVYIEGYPVLARTEASPPAEPLRVDLDGLREAVWAGRKVGDYPAPAQAPPPE